MRGFRRRLSSSIFFSVIPGILWQLLFLCVPLAFIICLSFVESFDNVLLITLEYYKAAASEFHLLVILRSLLVSLLASTICGVVAYPVAYFIALKLTNRWKNICLFLLTLPFWINFLLQVYAWYFILERNGVINSLLLNLGIISEPLHLINNTLAIILVMIHGYLPFMVLPIYSGMARFNTKLIEASHDLGASAWYTFWHITFPLTAAGIKTGFILILVMTFGEFTIPILLGGGKKLFVGTLISEYFFIVQNMSQGAAFMCFSGMILCGVILIINKIFNLFIRTANHEEK
jgi:spermidine/putrescine transport system permease protein